MPPDDPDWWTGPQAAAHCGIKESTWRDYVYRGKAPKPEDTDPGRPIERSRPRWRPATVVAWNATRNRRVGRPPKTH